MVYNIYNIPGIVLGSIVDWTQQIVIQQYLPDPSTSLVTSHNLVLNINTTLRILTSENIKYDRVVWTLDS